MLVYESAYLLNWTGSKIVIYRKEKQNLTITEANLKKLGKGFFSFTLNIFLPYMRKAQIPLIGHQSSFYSYT